MSARVYRKNLQKLLEQPLKKLGFAKKKQLSFIKGGLEVVNLLSFTSRIEAGRFFFTCVVGIHFNAIEMILRTDSSHEVFPTILVPIHLLHQDRMFFEWILDEATLPDQIACAVAAELREHALPFLDKYSDLEKVRISLESSNAIDWFVLNPEQRISTLAAIYHTNGDTQRAIEIVKNALAERQGALPKKRTDLENLLGHLLGSV